VAKFKPLGLTIPNQYYIHKKKLRGEKYGECLSPFCSEYVFPSEIKKVKIKLHKTVILPDVVHRCETWSLTLREEHRLNVSDNRVLRRIFGSKRVEVRRDR
jgi:hypothetical protein